MLVSGICRIPQVKQLLSCISTLSRRQCETRQFLVSRDNSSAEESKYTGWYRRISQTLEVRIIIGRRRCTAAPLLRSFCHDGVYVGVYVGGCLQGVYCVSTLKWKLWSEWLENWHSSSPRHYVEGYWFLVLKVKSQGHMVIISNFWHQLPPGE